MKGPKPIPLADRLERLSIRCPMSGCWIFMGWLLPHGYGHIGRGGRARGTLLAHRAAWIAHRGEIPAGKCVLHRCDVRCCVNPEHLFLGTLQDNTNDMMAKGRHRIGPRYGEKNAFSRLTDEAARLIKFGPKSAAAYARQFGIGISTAQQCRQGRTWKHITKTGTKFHHQT